MNLRWFLKKRHGGNMLSEVKFSSKILNIERNCKNSPIDIYNTFKMIDDETWSSLLLDCPSNLPNIQKTLPKLPSEEIQKKWNGELASKIRKRSLGFYQSLKNDFIKYNQKNFNSLKILDFGCGWGRTIRFFLKDIPSNNIYGVDPDEKIIGPIIFYILLRKRTNTICEFAIHRGMNLLRKKGKRIFFEFSYKIFPNVFYFFF